jgi:hypothetical protein
LKRAYTKHGDEDAQIDLRAVVADCPHEKEGETCEDHDARDEELTFHWFVPGSHDEWCSLVLIMELFRRRYCGGSGFGGGGLSGSGLDGGGYGVDEMV